MGRLRRFPDYRIVGRRDQMVAFDCDDESQFALLQQAVQSGGLDMKNLLQAFAPDTMVEAKNRGFRSSSGVE
ncbi:MAG: hypothetical protein ACXW15_11485 [Acidimicrobiia bacterium]